MQARKAAIHTAGGQIGRGVALTVVEADALKGRLAWVCVSLGGVQGRAGDAASSPAARCCGSEGRPGVKWKLARSLGRHDRPWDILAAMFFVPYQRVCPCYLCAEKGAFLCLNIPCMVKVTSVSTSENLDEVDRERELQ